MDEIIIKKLFKNTNIKFLFGFRDFRVLFIIPNKFISTYF